jgi:hypothetical protein
LFKVTCSEIVGSVQCSGRLSWVRGHEGLVFADLGLGAAGGRRVDAAASYHWGVASGHSIADNRDRDLRTAVGGDRFQGLPASFLDQVVSDRRERVCFEGMVVGERKQQLTAKRLFDAHSEVVEATSSLRRGASNWGAPLF